ncbi:MAG: tetratricopeptide repeat protein [Sphingobacteriales bacterium]|nr:MAG: tetratricopeptide repeat protein [Sphingobacteriales bacterium]
MVFAGGKPESKNTCYMIRSIITLLMVSVSILATAQKKELKKGNNLYEKGNYQEATKAYQEAIAKDPKNVTGMHNMGNALYQQKQYEAARKVMGATTQVAPDKNSKSAASYNIGNTYMQERKWEDAVKAYKQALRNNPQDPDAKYNLSYALAMMKKEGGGGGGKNGKKDNKDQKDQNKDPKNQDNKDKQDQKKQDQDKQQDQNQDQKEEEKQDQQRKPQPSKLSEQQAEQLLNALQQEEKNLQDKMQKTKGSPVKIDKDW